MRWMKPMVAACAAATVVVGGFAITGHAQMDEAAPATKPAEKSTDEAKPAEAAPKPAVKRSTRQLKLVQPWSLVADLTDEQRQQIFDIHEDFKAKLKALELEEEEKCNAVLTEAQRTQLAEAQDQKKADQKAKAADKRAADKGEKKAD